MPALPDWFEGPSSPWRRLLAVLTVALFLVACVPLVVVFAGAQIMRALLPDPSPRTADVLALLNIAACVVLELIWLGGLVWVSMSLFL